MVDGQALDPKLHFLREYHQRRDAGAEESDQVDTADAPAPIDTPEGRAQIRASVDRSWMFRTRVTAEMASVTDDAAPGRSGDVPVRVYRPDVFSPEPLPVLLYFHGGGWLFGSVQASDRAARLIANEARVIVVSVDYRLAPEHPWPAAWDDAEDAWLWTVENAARLGGDPARIGVGGDSAGGNLAISVSTRQIQAGRPAPAYQLLYYPAVDVVDRDYASFDLFGEGYGLDAGFARYATDRVFPGGDLDHPEASPLLADSVAGLPPTILATAGFDILRDAGRAYARRLEDAGVPVLFLEYDSLNHGFLQWSGVIDDAGRAATDTARVFGHAIRSRRPPH